MLKKELLNVLSEKLGIKKIETEKFLDTLEEIITEELKKGEDKENRRKKSILFFYSNFIL